MHGTGTFRVKFLDGFDRLDASDLEAAANIKNEPTMGQSST